MRPIRVLVSVTLVLGLASAGIIAACSDGSTDDLQGIGGKGNPDSGPAGDDAPVTIVPTGDDAPSGFIADAGPPDTFLPLNAVDAADTPEGGKKVTPGVIPCGGGGATCNAFAGNQCCTGDDGGACLATSVACSPSGGSIACNESADCVVGKACCGSVTDDDAGGGPYVSAACAASCPAVPGATPLQLCRTNGECGDAGPCVIQNCSDGHRYELCGLFQGSGDGGLSCTPQ